MTWRIYYTDQVVEGDSEQEWVGAPDEGVQVVVLYESASPQRWSHWPEDRQAWTGLDLYDPFGWGPKSGELIPTDDYFKIWEAARGDPRA